MPHKDDEGAGPSGVGAGSERRPSSSGPHPDHSYAVASGHDPLSPRSGQQSQICNVVQTLKGITVWPCPPLPVYSDSSLAREVASAPDEVHLPFH